MQDANTVSISLLPVKHNLNLSQYSKTNDEKWGYKDYAGVYITNLLSAHFYLLHKCNLIFSL